VAERTDYRSGLAAAELAFGARVTAVRDVTPHMRRLTIAAAEFTDYAPVGPDEYLALLLPRNESVPLVLPANDGTGNIRAAIASIPGEERPDLRWYTLRDHRPDSREIDIDFVLHGDEGPGTRFAGQARVGSTLGIRECTALYAPLPGTRVRVIIGDESSLPTIARVLEATDAPETHVFHRDSRCRGQAGPRGCGHLGRAPGRVAGRATAAGCAGR
jgi:NADPH-dependent ferric siderophore reductase